MSEKSKTVLIIIAILLATIIIMVWRRPGQFIHPYIWVEEGVVTLPDYIHHGWLTLFHPVAGYLVIPSKLIFLTAISISFIHLPALEYWFTIFFSAGVIITIALAPTILKWRYACALFVLLLPVNPEVYAVSEYAFWWGTLLAFVVLLWDTNDKRHLPLRIALLLIGGFSSPMIIPISVVLALRAAATKLRTDAVVAVTGILVAAIQACVMHATAAHSAFPKINVMLLLEKFFGYFSYQPPSSGDVAASLLGLAIILCIATFVITRRRWRTIDMWLILACLGMAIIGSIARVPIEIIHPSLAGPRYFFYPFIFLAWILIWIAASGNLVQRSISFACLAGAIIVFSQVGQRHSDKMDWVSNVSTCEKSVKFDMPIQTDGNKDAAWHVRLNGADCRRLSGNSRDK